MEPRSEFFEVNGLRVHALVAGPAQGTPVVLLHGFPELAESWREVMQPLAQAGYRAVAPDLRGYGQTDAPRDGYDLDQLARDAAGLIRVLGGSAHLVGHDWGGTIAYETAANHPAQVKTLTVVNAPHPEVMARRVWRPAQFRRSWYMFFFQLPFLPEHLLSKDGGARVPRILRAAARDKRNFTDERLAPYARFFASPERVRAPVEFYRQSLRRLLRPRYWAHAWRYPKIQAPFRLIWGTEDVALGRELTVELDGWFERPVEVRYLEGLGHFGMIEAPERIAPLLLEHVRAHA